MVLTPLEPLTSRHLAALVNNALANISAILESVGAGSVAVYKAYRDSVYLFISDKPVRELPSEPPRSLLTESNGAVVLAFRSPLHGSMIEGFAEPCSAIDHVLVELLDIADSIECVEERGTVAIEVRNPKLSTPGRLEKVAGSIYGIIAASAAALIRKDPYVVEVDEASSGGRRVVVKPASTR